MSDTDKRMMEYGWGLLVSGPYRGECPCIVATMRGDEPICGRADCWHTGPAHSDCALCHKTGYVGREPPRDAKAVTRERQAKWYQRKKQSR